MRNPAKSFEDLIVWQKAHQLVLATYKITGNFPKSEQFGLTAQMRRAAVSVPANIAEGFKKRSKDDKLRYLNISQGSLEESRYYQILVRDLKFGDFGEASELLEEVSRLLEGYGRAITQSRLAHSTFRTLSQNARILLLHSGF